jgi:hypothetical protein
MKQLGEELAPDQRTEAEQQQRSKWESFATHETSNARARRFENHREGVWRIVLA